jgi:hypothetical protein
VPLHISKLEYPESPFPKYGPLWDETALPTSRVPQAIELATPPSGKHDLTLCESFEREWRNLFPPVLSLLCGERMNCLIWAYGPLEQGGLLRTLCHVLDDDVSYHLDSVTHIGAGYSTSWCSFEYREALMRSLMSDQMADLEYTTLAGIIMRKELTPSLLTRPFHSIGIRWVLDNHAIAFTTYSHFECMYIANYPDSLADVKDRLQRAGLAVQCAE